MYFHSLGFGYFTLMFVSTAFGYTVIDIILLTTQKEMMRVDTTWVITGMKYLYTFWDFALAGCV